MKRLLAFLLCTTLAATALAQAPQPPEVAAKSYLLLDMTSNQVLAERDADAESDPASLTKLMTGYIVFAALRDKKIGIDQQVTVSVRAWNERKLGGSLMFIEPRSQPKVSDLLRGMIVNSGNDASVALAEVVGGSVENFVDLMNRQAQAWGLKNTQFKNVTGLTEPGHRSTARDMSVIAAHIINDFPEYYTIYSIRKYRFDGAPASNENNRNVLLLRDPSVDGMKTGHTDAAGYCLVASAAREFPNLAASGNGGGKRRLLSVLLNTTSANARADESQRLLNWGFTAFETVRLFEAGQAIVSPQVWKGSSAEAKLGTTGAVFVTVPKGDAAKLQTRVERTDPLVAPLAKGQRVGTLKVSLANGGAVTEVPLLVQEEVPLAGILGRAWDSIRLWIK